MATMSLVGSFLFLFLLGLRLFFAFIVREHLKLCELFLNEFDGNLESSFFSHGVNLFSGHILLLDKSFQDFEPLSGSTVRNAVTTTSATMSFATLLLSFFILFWEDGDHHDRILAGVLDLQESMRVRESLLAL